MYVYRVQMRLFKFTVPVFNTRTKMASKREEETVSEKREDWGKSDKDGKWVSSAESSLVIDPYRQTARCYNASLHKM
jgi:hypothetical protein